MSIFNYIKADLESFFDQAPHSISLEANSFYQQIKLMTQAQQLSLANLDQTLILGWQLLAKLPACSSFIFDFNSDRQKLSNKIAKYLDILIYQQYRFFLAEVQALHLNYISEAAHDRDYLYAAALTEIYQNNYPELSRFADWLRSRTALYLNVEGWRRAKPVFNHQEKIENVCKIYDLVEVNNLLLTQMPLLPQIFGFIITTTGNLLFFNANQKAAYYYTKESTVCGTGEVTLEITANQQIKLLTIAPNNSYYTISCDFIPKLIRFLHDKMINWQIDVQHLTQQYVAPANNRFR